MDNRIVSEQRQEESTRAVEESYPIVVDTRIVRRSQGRTPPTRLGRQECARLVQGPADQCFTVPASRTSKYYPSLGFDLPHANRELPSSRAVRKLPEGVGAEQMGRSVPSRQLSCRRGVDM